MPPKNTYAWDLRSLAPHAKSTVEGALAVCDYPFGRIRRTTKARVPVTVADTSRAKTTDAVHILSDSRRAALGLFWLPTHEYPAGRIELSDRIMQDVPLAQEVFLAEAAHAVDYGSMTDAEREAIFTIVHGGDATQHGTHGWYEERGGQDYWQDWTGEVFMALFMRAFAPTLPRPLEARQPWVHTITPEMAAQVRRLLRRRKPPRAS